MVYGSGLAGGCGDFLVSLLKKTGKEIGWDGAKMREGKRLMGRLAL